MPMPMFKRSTNRPTSTTPRVATPLVVKKKMKTATAFESFDPWANPANADDFLLDHESKHDDSDYRLERTTRWRGNNANFDEPVAGSGCVSIQIDFGSLTSSKLEVPHHVIFACSTMNVRPDWRKRVDSFLAYTEIPREMPNTTDLNRAYKIIKSLPLTAESDDQGQTWIDSRGAESLSKFIGQFVVDLKRHNPLYTNAQDIDWLLSQNPLILSFDCAHRLFEHPEFWSDNFDQVDTKPFPVDLEPAEKRDYVHFVRAMKIRDQDVSFLGFACEVIAQCRPIDLQNYESVAKFCAKPFTLPGRLVSAVHKSIMNHVEDGPLLRKGCRALCSLGRNLQCLKIMIHTDALSCIVNVAIGDKQKDEALQLSVIRFLARASRAQFEDSDTNEALRSWLTTMETLHLVLRPLHGLGTTELFEAGLDALLGLSLCNGSWNSEASVHVMNFTLMGLQENGDHLFIQTHGCALILFLLSTDSSGEATQMLVRSSPGGFSAILARMLAFPADEYLQSHVSNVLQRLPSEALLCVMRDFPDAVMVQEAGFTAMVNAEASAVKKGLLFGVSSIRTVLATMERHPSLRLAGCKVIMHLATWDFCENGPLAVEIVSAILSAADAHTDPDGVILATVAALRARGNEHINTLFLDFIQTARKIYQEEQPNSAPAFEVFLDLSGESKLSACITVVSLMKKFPHNETIQFFGCELLDAMTVSGEERSNDVLENLVEARAENDLSAASTAFPNNAPLVAHAMNVYGRMEEFVSI